MLTSIRAELLRLRKWPTTWIIGALWLLLNLTFAYVFPYLSYRSAVADGDQGTARGLLADMTVAQVPVTLVQGLPMFGGAMILILAALATGSGFGWNTWKTVFTQGPRRLAAFGGTVVAVAAVVIGIVAATLLLDLGASAVVMSLEDATITWPAGTDLGQGAGAALLIAGMYAMGGIALGVLARGPALSVGLGLVWCLVVENLLRGVGGLLGPVGAVTDVLPGTAAGSLAGALGAAPGEAGGGPDGSGTPGVLTVLSGGQSTLLLSVYLVVFVVVAGWLMHRRDA